MKLTNRITVSKRALAALLINVGTMVILFLSRAGIPPQVPLFYGMATGPSQLAPREALFLPSILALIALIVNEILERTIKDTFIGSVVGWASLVFACLASITVIRIMLLVGSF